jgi:hypothetical protein
MRKDLTQLHRGMERLERTSEQWRQEMRQEMQQWRLSTTRQLSAMVGSPAEPLQSFSPP